jgi:O-antigen ligase
MSIVLTTIAVGNLVLTSTLQDVLPVDYLLVCLAICGLVGLYRLRTVGRRASALIPLGLFLAGSSIGYLSSSNSPYALNKYLTFVMVCLVAAAIATLKDQSRVSRPFMVCLLVVGAASSVLLLTLGAPTATGRFSLFDLNPIGLARATGLSLVIAVSLLIGMPRSRWRAGTLSLWMVVGTVGLIATVSTGSRGPLLSSVVALICVAAVAFRSRGSGVVSLILLVAFALVAYRAVLSFGGSGLDRLESGVESGRSDLYAQTWEIISEQPVLGIGWGNFPLYIFDYASDDGTLYPHNILLEIWMEGGLLALLGFIALSSFALVRTYKAAKKSPWALATLAVLVYALMNALFSSDVVGNRLMWVLLVIGLLSNAASVPPRDRKLPSLGAP